MLQLLEEYYRQNLSISRFISRKSTLDDRSTYLYGVAQSGKTALIKHYLLTCKKNSYLYLDCRDLRLDADVFNRSIDLFCLERGITIVALDNYAPKFKAPRVTQLILSGEHLLEIPQRHFRPLQIRPLDYEEFLAYEPKYDSTALNHFLQLGGYPAMHALAADQRTLYIQQMLSQALSPMELKIIGVIANSSAVKLSAYSIYERLKHEQRISKDKLYKEVVALIEKKYIYEVSKFAHERAIKKLYLCDIAIKNALTIQKHFGRLFENLVFLEMHKRHFEIFYVENIDFYLPQHQRIVLCMPFGAQDALFKKIESIESFIIAHNIVHVEVVTVSSEGSLQHPFVSVQMLPFSEWAIIEGEEEL